MKSLKQLKNCIFVYLDVHLDDIDKRLGDLKVDRIVGASSSVPPKLFLPKLKLQDDTDTLASSDYNEETGFIWPSPQIKQTNNTGFLILLHSLSTYNKLWSKKGWREKEVMQNLPTFRQLRAIQQMSSLLALKWPT